MSLSKTYIIRSQLIADNACKAILSNWERMQADGKPMCVEIKRTSRSLEQNKRYWAILHRFSKAVKIGGRTFAPETLHEFFKREFIGITALPNGMPMAKSSAELTVDQFGEYIFKVGEGPTWCTISPAIDGDNSGGNVICEQNEAAALYKPIPIPASCDYSFGYQVRLMGVPGAVEGTDTASFTCASGFYADPSEAPILAAGQRITVAPFKCFVEDVNVRCENETGQYIALGPKIWALGN